MAVFSDDPVTTQKEGLRKVFTYLAIVGGKVIFNSSRVNI
jgi:hypothetical protein